ncbi:MAG: SRPBCC family protein [Pseudomonadota bacterium]
MTKTVIIEKNTVIDMPIDRVWQVSAVEFAHIDRWDGNVKTSDPIASGPTGENIGGRVCKMYNKRKTVERIVEFDEGRRTFAYEITEGLPGFVILARNTWTHQAIANNSTKLTMRLMMQVRGLLGTLMKAPMKSQMSKVLSKAQEELKHYAETGQPHSRKRKKMKKLQRA